MQVKKLILSGLVFAAVLPVRATNWYYVGASNDWWNAASYSTTTSPSGNTTMPGAGDLIYPQSGQALYMDDTTVAFLNTVDGFYFPSDFKKDGASLYINLTTNATVTCALGEIGGHNFYRSWLVKDGAGVLYLDGRDGLAPSKGIFGSGTSKNSYRYAISFDVRDGALHLEPKRSDVFRSYMGGIKIAEGATFFTASGDGQQALFYGSLEGAGTFTSDHTGTAYPVHISGDYPDNAIVPPSVFSGVVSGKMTVYVFHSTYFTGVNNATTIRPAGYTEGSVNVGFVGIKTYAGSFAGKGFSTKDNAGSLLFLNEEDDYVDFDEFSVYNSPFALDAGPRGGVTISPKN